MNLIQIENTNIYEFHTLDKINEESAKKLSDTFHAFKVNNQKIKLLGTVEKITMPESISTIDDLFKMKINALNVIEKYAVLTDENWLKKAVTFGNFITPNIPVKSFALNERAAAITWLNDVSTK